MHNKYLSSTLWSILSFVISTSVLFIIFYIAWRAYISTQPCSVHDFLVSDFGNISLFISGGVGGIIATTVFVNISERKTTLEDEQDKLIKTQKQHVEVLKHFGGIRKIEWFKEESTIYKSIIDVLDRAFKIPASRSSSPKESFVKLLLCSPALDYHGNKSHKTNKGYKNWGDEIKSRIENLFSKLSVIELDITYLPNFPIFGYNPIKDFVSVLANYCTHNNNQQQFVKTYNEIAEGTDEIIKLLEQYEKKTNRKIKINYKFNIPFQMVLVSDKEINDVVVMFAGREIIESRNKVDPKGFRSSDPEVVALFSEIYQYYVDKHTRRPFPPIHTIAIGNKLKSRSNPITIKNYLGNFLPESFNLIVNQNVFCPAVGNSSKFTSLVLAKSDLNKKIVLDVGSGTGVQAMVAAICGASKVVASEQNDNAFDNLSDNIKNLENKNSKYNKIIEPIKGYLFSPITQYKGIFDVIIGDIPFVNAKLDQNSPIHQCLYDNNHDLHKLLLTKSKEYIKKSGMLYTSFSTLGGPEDVEFFEELIHNTGWRVHCKHTFFEDGYGWFVYELSQEEKSWWNFLCVHDIEEQIQSKSTIST